MLYTVTLNPALDREYVVLALAFDEVLRAAEVRVDPGGKGFNVSRAIAALGGHSTALGFLGGATGRRLAADLMRASIAMDIVWTDGETRTNTSVISRSQNRYLKVNEAGAAILPNETRAMTAKVRGLARQGDWWVLSGSLPPGVAPDYYAILTEIIQSAGGRVLLDTSGEPLRLGCRAGAWLIKPNRSEAEALSETTIKSPEEACGAAAAIRAAGAPNVVISLGQDGAILSTANRCWRANTPEIEERNPIGAGDALVAGLAVRLAAGDDLPAAFPWGVASGAAAASLDGTAFGSAERIAELRKQVRVTTLP